MAEGGGRFETMFQRRGPELQELLDNPAEAFDSSLDKANEQARKLQERLRSLGKSSRENILFRGSVELATRVEKGTSRVESLQIIWKESRSSDQAMMLKLKANKEGAGAEGGILAWTGEYGVAAKKNSGEFRFEEGKTTSLDKLFGVPQGLRLMVKLTANRWAVGMDELATLYGANVRTLHIGLGFLLLGHQFMLIGMHEAGRLPNTGSENEAWTKGNRRFARMNRPYKDLVKKDRSKGFFDLIRKPAHGDRMTIGQIVRYGLTSHWLGGNARIPKAWQARSQKTMDEFCDLIRWADEACAQMLR